MPDPRPRSPGRFAVIGAGVLGVCLAARLAEVGAQVTLLEQARPGWAATRWSFAWLNANDKGPRAYHELNHAGLRAWARLAARLGAGVGAVPAGGLGAVLGGGLGAVPAGGLGAVPGGGLGAVPGGGLGAVPGGGVDAGLGGGVDAGRGGGAGAGRSAAPGWYRPTGNLEWAASPARHEQLADRVGRLTGWGYPAQLIGAAAAAQLEPSLRLPGPVPGVAWFPAEGYLRTPGMISQLVAWARGHGATVLTGAAGRVTGLDQAGRVIRGVRTAAGQVITADAVLCCAGRWVPELAALAAAASPVHVSRVPLVGWAGPGATAPGLIVRAGPVTPPGPRRIVHAPGVYLRPHSAGEVQLEAPDAAVDLRTPDAELRRWAAELLRRARQVIRGLDGAQVTGYRVCVRPMPADGQSIVGWLPGADGLYLAVTHSGVTLGAHLAELIAAELTGGVTAADLAPYRPDRFRARPPGPG